MMQDVRYTLRTMQKSPGFTTVAVLALALGIGANTAIFTVVNAVLLRPLPYPNADRLVSVTRVFPGGRPPSTSIPKYFLWKRGTADVLEHVAVYDLMGPGVSLGSQGEPEQIKAIHATADYFPLFGVKPAAGRFFTAEEDRPGGPPVVVISHGLWKRRFGADQGIVGRSIMLGGEPFTVVGVTGPEFEPNPPTDAWFPVRPDPNDPIQGHYLLCGALLKPGVKPEAVNARLDVATRQFRKQFAGAMGDRESAGVISMRDQMVGEIRPVLLMLLGAVALVLLIACANVANLLLARAAAREKEIAVRVALGAGRARLVRQFLTESALLSFAGGVGGLLLGYWGLKLLLAFTPSEIPRLSDLMTRSGLDLPVLGFTLLISLLTGLIFGLAPALQISRPDLNSTLRESSGRSTGSVRHQRARGLLVAVEMALGLVLLIGAGLLIRSALAMRAVDPGFQPAHVLVFKTALTGPTYQKTAGVAQFSRQLVQRLEGLPGVVAAAATTAVPTEMGPDLNFEVVGRKDSEGDEQYRPVGPEFFKAMGIPLLRGRAFTDTDTMNSARVVIINEAFARKVWPKQDPLGQQILIGKGFFEEPPRQVVGIVTSVREAGLNTDPPPIMYIPHPQTPDELTALAAKVLPLSWVVRTQTDPLSYAAAVRREVMQVDPLQAAFEFKSLSQVLEKSLATHRFILLLLGIFAGTALLLAAIGIYGVMSYSVEQRTHEIGIRVALGAANDHVVGMVVRQGMLLAGYGLVAGLAAAFAATRALKALLYGVGTTDPLTFAAVPVALALVALLATWIPARRAARVDPIIALRTE